MNSKNQSATVSLLVHGRVLWTPTERPTMVLPPGGIPLMGLVRWEAMYLAVRPELAEPEAHCPVVASPVWQAKW